MQLSILSERRVFQPYGLDGGQPGALGINTLIRHNNGNARLVNFGGKNSTVVTKGDRLKVETPGGGGWGKPGSKRKIEEPALLPPKKAGGSLQNFLNAQNSV